MQSKTPRARSFASVAWSALLMVLFWFIIVPVSAGSSLFKLSPPSGEGSISVEEAIAGRRTVRSFKGTPLTERQLSTILWAANGITEPSTGKRAVPSAGALYPLEIYIALGPHDSLGLAAGTYHYLPRGHALEVVQAGVDYRQDVGRAALNQMWMTGAPVIILIAADLGRTTQKYGHRGVQYAHHEAGCSAQNIMIQARALGLESGIVGAFYDETVADLFSLPASQRPFLLLPVGR